MFGSGTTLGLFESDLGVELAVVSARRHPYVRKAVTLSAEGGREAALHQALEKLAPVPAPFTYVAVGEKDTFRKLVELPAGVSEREIEGVVRSEVSSFLPEDPESMEVRYQILPHPAGVKYVVVTAVQTAYLTALLDRVSGAKVNVRGIDTVPACAFRALAVPTHKWDSEWLVKQGKEGSMPLMGLVYGLGVATALVGVFLGPTAVAVSEMRLPGDPEADAQIITDELPHLEKFTSNRLELGTPISQVVVGSSIAQDADRIAKTMRDVPVTVGTWVSAGSGVTTNGEAAIGAGLYPLFRGGVL